MAKVTKEGSVPDKYHWTCEGDENVAENWKAKAVCVKDDGYDKDEPCGAEIEFTVKDIVMRFFRGTHFRHHYTAIMCPRCKKYVRIWDVPPAILKVTHTKENYAKATWDGFEDGPAYCP